MTQATLPSTGYLRLSQIVGKKAKPIDPSNSRRKNPQEAIPALIPISSSAWWQGVRDGKYPPAIKLSERVTAWKVEDIRYLIENPGGKFFRGDDVSK